ncbi:MAG: DUF4406 domain-containing protein [Oscillospiraceae bacterium]|jgi:hypothetical protein|nr:DUF4406 domain-containing protein [Oscillospiraceae bacterium]
MKKVYICSPYRAYKTENYEMSCEDNVLFANMCCRNAVKEGYFPVAPHIYLTQFLDDDKENEREIGFDFDAELIKECEAMWVCGEYVSDGMNEDISSAVQVGVPVYYKGSKDFESNPVL